MAVVYSGDEVHFRCDFCSQEFVPEEATDDTSIAWLEAEADGWEQLEDKDGRPHCCPSCFESGAYETDSH